MPDTLLWMDGFDTYATADIATECDGIDSNGAGYPLISATGRWGGQCIQLRPRYSAGSDPCAFDKSFKGNQQKAYLAFAFRIGSSPAIAQSHDFVRIMEGSNVHLTLGINATRNLYVTSAAGTVYTSATSLSADQFYYLVLWFQIGNVTGVAGTYGAFTLYIDGVATLTQTNIDTQTGANAYATLANFRTATNSTYGNPANGPIFSFDDAWADTAVNHGDVRIQEVVPAGAGALTQWTPSVGTNHDCVNEALLDLTDYIDSSVVGNIDLYTHGGVSAAATVKAVAIRMVGNKSDAGARAIRGVLRIGGVNYPSGADLALGATDAVKQAIFDTNPATAGAWTPAAVNGMEFGIKDSA